jgi:hypothetical protein
VPIEDLRATIEEKIGVRFRGDVSPGQECKMEEKEFGVVGGRE